MVKKSAFTLVEILIALIIFMITVGAMVPTLTKVKPQIEAIGIRGQYGCWWENDKLYEQYFDERTPRTPKQDVTATGCKLLLDQRPANFYMIGVGAGSDISDGKLVIKYTPGLSNELEIIAGKYVDSEESEESEESDTSEPVTEDAVAEDPTGENPEVSPDETADTPAEEITVVPVVIPAAEFLGSSPGESPGTSPKELPEADPEISPKESPKEAPKTSPAAEAGDVPAEDTEGNPHEDTAGNPPEETAPGSTREPKAYVSEPPEGCDYVLNINTGKFHCPECSSVEEMKDKNRRYFTGTREEAMEAGYSPCGRCKP